MFEWADPVWRGIWKLRVPPKVKEFIWRASWGIIPHGVNLGKKGIEDHIRCPRCGMEESLLHILRDCFWVKNVWKAAQLALPACSLGSF